MSRLNLRMPHGSPTTSPVVRRVAPRPQRTRPIDSCCAACATGSPSHRATCGHAPQPPSNASRRPMGPAPHDRQRPPRAALGFIAGVAVVAVVLGATVLSGGYLNGPPSVAIGQPATLPPVAAVPSSTTPVRPRSRSGQARSAGSAPIPMASSPTTSRRSARSARPSASRIARPSGSSSKQVDMQIRPKSISKSPVRNQAVVVGTNAAGDDTVLVIALPTSGPTATPASSGTPSSAPSASPIVTASPASPSPTPRSTAVGTASPRSCRVRPHQARRRQACPRRACPRRARRRPLHR